MESSTLRKRAPATALLDSKIVVPAIGAAFAKLDPRSLIKNPVIFVLEIVTLLTTVILVRDLATGRTGAVNGIRTSGSAPPAARRHRST